MNQEKNHWLALYLSGKYPRFFKTPDKLLFIDALQSINPNSFSDEKIKMFGMFGQVNEYEFYLSFLNKVERTFSENFPTLLSRLQIPKEIQDKCLKFFDHNSLLQEFEKVEADDDKTTKGKAFEGFLNRFFDAMDGLEVINIEQAKDEQIDLVIKNNINRPFWAQLGSPLFIGEAKNWTKNTPTEVFNTLKGKMDGHKNFSRIGIVIAMKDFTSVIDQTIMRDGAGDKIIFPITGENIRKLLVSKQNPIDWLEEQLTNAFR